jgi:hypothetical protein
MDPHSQYRISSYYDAHGSQDTPKSPIWPEMAGISMVHYARYRITLHRGLCMLNNFYCS